jgi:hypothetical protein
MMLPFCPETQIKQKKIISIANKSKTQLQSKKKLTTKSYDTGVSSGEFAYFVSAITCD